MNYEEIASGMSETGTNEDTTPEHLDLIIRSSNRLVAGVVAFCVALFAAWAVLLRAAPAFLGRRLGGVTAGLLVYLAMLATCFLACCWYSRRRRRRIDPRIALVGKEELYV